MYTQTRCRVHLPSRKNTSRQHLKDLQQEEEGDAVTFRNRFILGVVDESSGEASHLE